MQGNKVGQRAFYKDNSSKAGKKSLRFFYSQRLNNISTLKKRQKDRDINQLILKLPFLKQAKLIAVYKAFKKEPDLSSFCSVWKKKICFPVIKKDKIDFYTNRENLWKKNKFNILEPISNKKNQVKLKDISIFFLPGLAFDRLGGRLGRGYAYYDKTLSFLKKSSKYKNQKNWNKKPLLIGTAFTEQIHEKALPLFPHDILMDCLITDQFLLWPLKSKKGGK